MIRALPTLVAAGCMLWGAASKAAPTSPPRFDNLFSTPELGVERYAAPRNFGDIWLGAEARATALPHQLGLSEFSVWATNPSLGWSVGLAPWLSVGGHHGLAWFGTSEDIKTRFAFNQVELVSSPLSWRAKTAAMAKHRDRLAFGIEFHRLQYIEIEDFGFEIGGARDVVLRLGYSMLHRLHRRLDLGWNFQLRHGWVYESTQRQLRVALRTRVALGRHLGLMIGGSLYLVHRDEQQRGVVQERFSPHIQARIGPGWTTPRGLVIQLEARYAYGLLGGEIPVYEASNSVIRQSYADAAVRIDFDWRRLLGPRIERRIEAAP